MTDPLRQYANLVNTVMALQDASSATNAATTQSAQNAAVSILTKICQGAVGEAFAAPEQATYRVNAETPTAISGEFVCVRNAFDLKDGERVADGTPLRVALDYVVLKPFK